MSGDRGNLVFCRRIWKNHVDLTEYCKGCKKKKIAIKSSPNSSTGLCWDCFGDLK